MYRTTPFQNPATARTAGSCERTGATKAPVLSPALSFVPRKRAKNLRAIFHKSANSGPNPACTRREGRELCPSLKEATQPLTRPNRGRSSPLRLPARRPLKVGPGFRPDCRSSGGAESDNVGQALCLPHLGDGIGYISASGACFKDRICSSVAPISPLTQMDLVWMVSGIYVSS